MRIVWAGFIASAAMIMPSVVTANEPITMAALPAGSSGAPVLKFSPPKIDAAPPANTIRFADHTTERTQYMRQHRAEHPKEGKAPPGRE
jgi:hypothetical protein